MRYTALPLCSTRASAVIPQRTAPAAPGLNMDSPAVAAMTNFAHDCPVTVSPERPIDDALQDMIRAGIRALLVLEEGHVKGLITSYDIPGERPQHHPDREAPGCGPAVPRRVPNTAGD